MGPQPHPSFIEVFREAAVDNRDGTVERGSEHAQKDRKVLMVPTPLPYNPPTHSEMGLAPGTRIGPYEVVSAIGAGGMGEVTAYAIRA
jgi:hypothetical protein